MPGSWSVPLDIDRLADGHAEIDFVVPVAELARLRTRYASVAGSVAGRVRFERQAGLAVAELTIEGTAQLLCQRCLAPMGIEVSRSVRIGLVAAEADASRVPEDLEPVLAPQGRVSIGDLVEEELSLSLPIVPLHASGARCGVAQEAAQSQQRQGEPTRHKPFERLGELLKRK